MSEQAYLNACGALQWGFDPNTDAAAALPRATDAVVDELAEVRLRAVCAEADCDAGWAAAEKLCESLREIAKGFDDDGYLYNRDEVLKVVAWFDAARAKRGTA